MRLGARTPTVEQELLLRAALHEGPDAIAAWEAWRQRMTLDDSDYPSHRLLPLVYRNLAALGYEDPDLGRMRGYLRRTLYANHVLFAAAAGEIAALNAVGIDTLVLKGAPLALLHYDSVGLRPMADVDVLVPNDRALDAIAHLRGRGWSPVETERPEERLLLRHSVGFRNADGGSIDLHWHAVLQPARDDELWASAVTFELAGVSTRTPCATDSLLLVIVHALMHWGALGGIRWVPDAVTLLRSPREAIDWDRLVAEARRRRVTVAARAGLAYLDGLVGSVPEGVLPALAASRATPLERLAFRAAGVAGSQAAHAVLLADRHARLRRLRTPYGRTPDLLDYLARSLGHPRRRTVLLVTARELVRHARPRTR